MPSLICTCLVGPSLEDVLGAAKANLQHSDLFELRLDRLELGGAWKSWDIEPLVQQSFWLINSLLELGLPIILTLRHQADGGAWPSGHEALRFELLDKLADRLAANPNIVFDIDAAASVISTPQRGIDYEAANKTAERIATLQAQQAAGGARVDSSTSKKMPSVIRSIHSFEPGLGIGQAGEELAALAAVLPPGGLAKLALWPASLADTVQLFQAGRAQEAALDFVLLGMGEFGASTRILAAKMGSAWTYATPPPAPGAAVPQPAALAATGAAVLQPAAPGQLDPELLDRGYGFRRIGKETTVFGILGNPVAHSRSPEFHNKIFLAQKLDAVYIPVLAGSVDEAFALAQEVGVRGFSVTVPHKEAVRGRLAAEDQGSSLAGACNTVFRMEHGWQGVNTDIPGLLDPLPAEIRGTVLILGAGGAARAALAGLAARGLPILLANRTFSRAQQLAAEFEKRLGSRARIRPLRLDPQTLSRLGQGAGAAHFESTEHFEGTEHATPTERREQSENAWHPDRIELIIQTTSLGMEDELDASQGYHFQGFETAYDIVYNRGLTPFLRRARAAGCKILEGGGMFEAQARLQSEIFVQVAAKREQEVK